MEIHYYSTSATSKVVYVNDIAKADITERNGRWYLKPRDMRNDVDFLGRDITVEMKTPALLELAVRTELQLPIR